MPRYTLLLIILLFTCRVAAQKTNADSLAGELKKSLPDTAKEEIYYSLIYHYQSLGKHESAVYYADLLERMAKDAKDDYMLMRAYETEGTIYENIGKLEKAYAFYRYSYDLSINLNQKEYQSRYFHNMARLFRNQQIKDRYIDYLLEALKIDEKIYSGERILGTYSLLAQAYSLNNDYNKAIEYQLKVIEITRALNKPVLECAVIDVLGTYYLKNRQLDLAEKTFKKAIDLGKKVNHLNVLSYSLMNYGDFFFEKKEYDNSLKYYKEGLEISKNQKLSYTYRELNNRIAEVLFNQKKFEEAKSYAASNTNALTEPRFYEQLLKNLQLLAKIDSAKGDFKNAFLLKNRIIDLMRITNNESKKKEIGNIIAKSEFENFEKTLQLEKEKRNLENENSLARQRLYLYAALIVIPFLIIVIYLLFKSKKQKQLLSEVLQVKVDERTAELRAEKEKAEASERLKTIFLSQMSHEIRTPLNAVISLSSILNNELSSLNNEDILDIVKSINKSGNRIIRTIEMILNYSEIINGSYQPIFKEISLNKICNLVVDELKYFAAERRIEMNFTSSEDELAYYGDEYSIHIIFKNLIENALIYTDYGKVDINIFRKEKEIVFSVKDTGIGISDEYQSILFRPFSQEEIGYTRKYEGLGLGLALSRFYCILNKAEIYCESKKGAGSVFNVVFTEVSA